MARPASGDVTVVMGSLPGVEIYQVAVTTCPGRRTGQSVSHKKWTLRTTDARRDHACEGVPLDGGLPPICLAPTPPVLSNTCPGHEDAITAARDRGGTPSESDLRISIVSACLHRFLRCAH
ncbi:hypothetical protein GCM10010361_53410 [Streptomyces olivaceiscleroticus]|uniref:Uncharacterized protein n=1 Tax=Streptomyces olivaceiscleroticus TaxID=68245 RepID=A0ABN1AQM5_9ACTN